MQNAPREPVYYDPELGPIYDDLPGVGLYLDQHPENVRDYLYGEAHYPLAEEPLYWEDPPPGQVLLVRPRPVPDDPFWAQVLKRNTDWLRIQSQNLILAGGSIRCRLYPHSTPRVTRVRQQ